MLVEYRECGRCFATFDNSMNQWSVAVGLRRRQNWVSPTYLVAVDEGEAHRTRQKVLENDRRRHHHGVVQYPFFEHEPL